MKMIRTLGMAVVAAGLMTTTTQAVQITGSIGFNGVPVFDNNANLALATKFNDFKWESVAPGQQVGDYGAIPNFAPVAFTPFTFVPAAPSIVPLWTLTHAGVTYSFEATSLTASYNANLQIWNIGGTGIASMTGKDATPGTWNLSAGKQGGSFFFGSATAVEGGPERAPESVPDGGGTLILLGSAILGLFGAARKLAA